ncbi:MAG: peptidylprolyl isomerase [Cyanobacteria bacterium J055]|nr:MAG: peptidylprolyl isomerase [Cyanobacteria bacterium J055]
MEGFKRWLQVGVVTLVLVVLSLGLGAAGFASSNYRESRLPQGNAITSPQALLQYGLPIDNAAVRELQENIEDIAEQLRANRRWSAVEADLKKARRILSNRRDDLLASVPEASRERAEAAIATIETEISNVEAAATAQDKIRTAEGRRHILATIGQLEALMVTKFPFEVPEEYSNLPQLKGRATVEIKTNKGTMTAIVDGYNAPVTAGNFIDLVQRGFYDDTPFVRAEESYVLQTGDPPGKEDGFIDPKTGEYRTIPLEIRIRSQNQPLYGVTLEEAGLYRESPVLPFSAFGTLGMAHPDFVPNGGSSQFFFFLFEPELTPAGLNLLDGRYAVFGYVVDGMDILDKLGKGDRIESIKVIRGEENLVSPQ